MWKIFFIYKDKSRCTVQGKGTITPELAVKCYYRYGLHAAGRNVAGQDAGKGE